MTRNLEKANEVLESISKQNKNITPITPQDYDLFNKFFANEPHTYGNSWSYIIQGMYGIGKNNLGYKYFDGENLSAISIHPKIEKPDQLALYFVRPMGKGMMKIIAELGKKYKKKFTLQIYAKKLFKNQYDELIKLGFKNIKENPWYPLAPAEDDTFPEIIYNPIEVLDSLKRATRRKNIKKSYKRALNLKKLYNIKFESKNFKTDAWGITENFFIEQRKNKRKPNFSNAYDYYNLVNSTNSKQNTEKMVIYLDGKPLAYYYLEISLEKHLSIIALLTLRSEIKYLADHVFFRILEKYKEYETINFGGSEDKGIHEFKTKFRPYQENQMYWVTLF